MNARPARRRSPVLETQSHQPPCDASVAAVQHADDHFLSDITALRERDGARLYTRLERDDVVVHVDAKQRVARFHTRRVEGGFANTDRAGALERRYEACFPGGVDIDGESGNTELV